MDYQIKPYYRGGFAVCIYDIPLALFASEAAARAYIEEEKAKPIDREAIEQMRKQCGGCLSGI